MSGASIAQVHASPFASPERNTPTVIFFHGEDRYAILTMPGCQITRLPHAAQQRGQAGVQVLPGGAQLLRSNPPQPTSAEEARFVYWYSPGPAFNPVRVPDDFFPGKREFPILSQDGAWLAVLKTVRTPAENRNEIFLRKAISGESRTIWPRGTEFSWHELVAIDAQKEEVVLARGLREYLWIRFDGTVISGPVHTGDVHAQPPAFRWTQDGWFAWDAYLDAGSYGVRLKTTKTDRHVKAEKLRRLNHAAISPDARHAAMSLETEHGRLLRLRDAVTILDMATGKEIFRRYLPRFTRSEVAFPSADFFAYSEPGSVRVLRLPKPPHPG